MEANERRRGVDREFRSAELSVEGRIERLRDTIRHRNDQENSLLERLSVPGPLEQSDIQTLWLDLLRTLQEVDNETKTLMKEKLKR